MLPPGTKIILHAKPGKRSSWEFHGEQGYYIGPAITHYQRITCYVPKMHRERITDTAKIIPRNIPIPQANYEEHLRPTADDLIHLLGHKQNLLLPQAPQSAKSALLDIAKLLNQDTTSQLDPIKLNKSTLEGGCMSSTMSS